MPLSQADTMNRPDRHMRPLFSFMFRIGTSGLMLVTELTIKQFQHVSLQSCTTPGPTNKPSTVLFIMSSSNPIQALFFARLWHLCATFRGVVPDPLSIKPADFGDVQK